MTEALFVNRLEKALRARGVYTKKEIGVGYGIADLVLFRPNLKNCRKRINHRQYWPLLNEGYFQVFNLLPDITTNSNPLNLDKLQQQTHYSSSFLKYKLLRNLQKARYVQEVDGNYYCKINGWLPIGRELTAIEAKLHDWKRGFYQTNRYRSFADKVYLAVPFSIVPLVDYSMLIKHGVGLLSFNATTLERKIVIESKTRKPLSDTKRSLASEYFWNQRLRRDLVPA